MDSKFNRLYPVPLRTYLVGASDPGGPPRTLTGGPGRGDTPRPKPFGPSIQLSSWQACPQLSGAMARAPLGDGRDTLTRGSGYDMEGQHNPCGSPGLRCNRGSKRRRSLSASTRGAAKRPILSFGRWQRLPTLGHSGLLRAPRKNGSSGRMALVGSEISLELLWEGSWGRAVRDSLRRASIGRKHHKFPADSSIFHESPWAKALLLLVPPYVLEPPVTAAAHLVQVVPEGVLSIVILVVILCGPEGGGGPDLGEDPLEPS